MSLPRRFGLKSHQAAAYSYPLCRGPRPAGGLGAGPRELLPLGLGTEMHMPRLTPSCGAAHILRLRSSGNIDCHVWVLRRPQAGRRSQLPMLWGPPCLSPWEVRLTVPGVQARVNRLTELMCSPGAPALVLKSRVLLLGFRNCGWPSKWWGLSLHRPGPASQP